MEIAQSYKSYKLSWVENVAVSVVKMGPMPNHIAIILDGNRRFARENKLKNVTEGHKSGSIKVGQIVEMLLTLGIPELSLYAFSSENFKRPQEEVNGLMELFLESAKTIENKLKSEGGDVNIEFLGNLEKTPNKKLKRSFERTMLLSTSKQKLKVNACFIYTGRNEITKGANCVMQGLYDKIIVDDEIISEELLRETFTLHPSNPVDVLIRTSGECRLSDFLLWGSSEAYLEFVRKTWPEYSFWGLLWALVRFQNQVLFKGIKQQHETNSNKMMGEEGLNFIKLLREQKWKQISQSISS